MTPWEEYLAKLKAKGKPQPFTMVPEAYPPEPTPEPVPEPTEPDDSKALAMAEGMRNIGEGFGSIRFRPLPYHWGRGIMGMEQPAPYVAEGPRMAIGSILQERRDKLRLATEAARQGFQAREGELNRASREGVAAENREAANTRFGALLPIRQANLDLRQGELAMRAKRLNLSEEEFRRMPNADVNDLEGWNSALVAIGKVRDEYKPESFGPIKGRWQAFARHIGLANPETVATAADLTGAINQYIYASTGKQLNNAELGRLSRELPQTWDDPETFYAVLDKFEERIRDRYQSKLDIFQKQGRNVEPFALPAQEGGAATQGTPAQSQSGVTMILQDGTEVPGIHPAQVENFKKKYPGSRPK